MSSSGKVIGQVAAGGGQLTATGASNTSRPLKNLQKVVLDRIFQSRSTIIPWNMATFPTPQTTNGLH